MPHTPSAWTFWLSVALALLAVEAGDDFAFGSVVGLDWPWGYLVLVAGCTVKTK